MNRELIEQQAAGMRDLLEDLGDMHLSRTARAHVNAIRAHLKTIEINLGTRPIGAALVDDASPGPHDEYDDVRMLLDGLEVASIAELHATLEQARKDGAALDNQATLLRSKRWPGGADFLEYTATLLRRTGRNLDTNGDRQ